MNVPATWIELIEIREKRIEKLEAERDQFKRLFEDALAAVDRVFQVESGKEPPILPDFLSLGDCKWQGVVRLAEAYKRKVRDYELLQRKVAHGCADALCSECDERAGE